MTNISFTADLEPLFNPRSIAIIGASSDAAKPGGQPLMSLLKNKYQGLVFPVNPKYGQLFGVKCYPDLAAVPGDVDMAIIAVPAAHVLDALKQCTDKGVRVAVIFTSGFAEVGGRGAEMQAAMTGLARQSGMRICGPNCMGVFSARNALFANFFITDLPENVLLPDFLGFISQSGGLGSSIFEMIKDQGIGFTYFVSTGNEADLDFADYMAYMAADERTKVIGGYMEGVRDGARLARAAGLAREKGKPVLLLKTGRHAAAAKAAASHTGALAGSDRVFDAFFRQHNIIRADSVEHMMAVLTILAGGKLPPGNRLCILAGSGGTGVLMADICASHGLEMVPLAGETSTALSRLLPSFASAANPVDLTSQVITHPALLLESGRLVLADSNVDMLLICYWSEQKYDPLLDQLVAIARSTEKTVLVLVLGAEEDARRAAHYLYRHRVPAVLNSELAARALAAVARYTARQHRPAPATPPVLPAGAQEEVKKLLAGCKPGAALDEHRSKLVLRAYGIPVTAEEAAATPEQAVAAAARLGYPVALKILSPDITHKTEAGGVRLNLKEPGQVRRAFEEIVGAAGRYKPDARIDGVLVQEMLPEGVEMIAGTGRDAVFGPTVLFGLGGIFVEALQDIALRVAPLSPADAREMLDEIQGRRVLDGLRGKPPVDKGAVADVLLRLSRLALDFPQIAELDINPLLCHPGGIKAADALIVL
ncbi:acetate--CoA ligase family protein [Desulfotomaculum copahuensis]|uniref:CoA-binding protein n=1 Tax=Desulfotomaculum copahuensis TaxID=1838280 RepID=A0A1B7LH30_9FIRM|nr:acetate--CoA ligase family protein [Desulfotomaculum copahuensis]OAT85493.1 CoA-binding protein [Desulfotomaculum copahuensis]